MRRSIVLISFLAAAAALPILAPATPARAIICPQASPPCCPVPTQAARSSAHLQPICCQPAMCCATGTTTAQTCCPSVGCCNPPCVAGSLTIASSPNPSKAGTKVVISGAFTGNQSGAQVVLWRELAGQSSFHQMSQTTTDSSGHYTFTLGRGAVMADQAWYVTSDGLQSSTVQQQVNALVGLSSSARSTGVGHVDSGAAATSRPSHAGEVVLVEARRGGGAWRVIARPHLGRGSNYAVAGRFSRPGAVELRAVLPGDTRNERSTSPTVTVTVKP